MFKKVLLAVVPMVLVASIATADDDLLSNVASLRADMIQAAPIAIEDTGLDGLDIDGLAQNAGGEDEAIEACFRRFGYGGWGHGFGYGWGHRPFYSFYRPFYCYRPVTYCYPAHYWGCW